MTRVAFGFALGVASTLAAIVALARPFFVAAAAHWDQHRSLDDAQRKLGALRGGAR